MSTDFSLPHPFDGLGPHPAVFEALALRPDMSVEELRKIENPLLRAVGLAIVDLLSMKYDSANLVRSVNIPEASAYGVIVQDLYYNKVLKAKNAVQRERIEKKRQRRIKWLNGLGLFFIAAEAMNI